MKIDVLVKQKELKLKIDLETDKLLCKLDKYIATFKEQLYEEHFANKSDGLEEKTKWALNKSYDFKSRLDLVILDEQWWTNTSSEIESELNDLAQHLEDFKTSFAIKSDLDEVKCDVELFKNWPSIDIKLPNELM